MDCAVFCLSFNGRPGPLARQQTKKSLLKLLPDLNVLCVSLVLCLAPSAHLLSVSIVKVRFKGGALWRSPFMPTVRLRLLPRGRSTNGEQEEESVLPSVPGTKRPSIRSAPNDTAAKPTNFTVGFHAPSKSQSVVRSGAVKLLQFLRCSGFARKIQCPNVPLRSDRKSSRSGSERWWEIIPVPWSDFGSAFLNIEF